MAKIFTDEEFLSVIKESFSMQEAAQKLGYNCNLSKYHLFRRFLVRLKPDTSHFVRSKVITKNFTDDEFLQIVASSNSYREVSNKLTNKSKINGILKKAFDRLKPDITHFKIRNKREAVKGRTDIELVYENYKSKSFHKKRAFEITLEDFIALTKEKCHYCGQHGSNTLRTGVNMFACGVDRIDSKIGYVLNNVVPCCKRCNVAKASMTKSEFIDWVINTAKYQMSLTKVD